MSPTAKTVAARQEFWRPAMDDARSQEANRVLELNTDACERCGSVYALDARFCHACGHERFLDDPRARFFDLEPLKSALGLTIGALLAFGVGMFCALAAAVTGFLYTVATLPDWQAVQVWRVEWLLAAITAFMAGILLKH